MSGGVKAVSSCSAVARKAVVSSFSSLAPHQHLTFIDC